MTAEGPNRLAAMPVKRAIRALAALACALTIAACGGEDEGTIPDEQGQQLLSQLGAIQDAVDVDCAAARASAVEFASSVDKLPEEVDTEVRKALSEGSQRLVALTEDPEQCKEPDIGTTDVETTTEPTTTTTSTTSSTTTTEETTTEEEPPTDSGGGPPEDTPGNGNPGGGNFEGGSDGSSGGIGTGD